MTVFGRVSSLLVTLLLEVESPNALITQVRAKQFEERIFLKCLKAEEE